MREGGFDGFPFQLQTCSSETTPRANFLQYTNFVTLSDKKLVIVSPVITVHTLRKKGEVKIVSFLTRLHSSFVL